MSELTAAIIGGLSLGAVYSLVTLGIVIIFRATETFNFAHGSFMLLAALIVGRLQSHSGLPFALLALISLGIVGALGAMLFRFVLRSLAKSGGLKLRMIGKQIFAQNFYFVVSVIRLSEIRALLQHHHAEAVGR